MPGYAEVDQRRHDHAADRGRGGQDRAASVGELAGQHLAFDLEPDQQKKDCH